MHDVAIRIDDLNGPEIRHLLELHMAGMRASSPIESVHALDLSELRHPSISFWTAWQGPLLLGCGGLKNHGNGLFELKSMRTAPQHLRKGVARRLLTAALSHAKQHGCSRISLETGSTPDFLPAIALYEAFGFNKCGPFADYRFDPFSVFMTKRVEPSQNR